ncbi:BZ3500_MvSof-1268-A1-R1_Chr3-2g06273 [Microbotryum saponariae]|uniref:BZ3500_MvSof-1268-A1-R1_Chr3-2g06273 protein n=1 Tax=Microbotryum saponariae TaxID=289078 RepID=A0A2X0LBE4_9BASI|nr:BZ3500_MvSof-1268-A1-R1_Chr3-2g06273 [Microbotryum saponariae]SDA04244.1 BZ3501_MvSof-1269-A2-R1_Chr3-2g05964 [Microbotryum saponariae]
MSPSFPPGGPPPLPPLLRHARTSSSNTFGSSSSSSSSTGNGSPTRRASPFVDGYRSPVESIQSSTHSSRSADPAYAHVGTSTVRLNSRRSSAASDGHPHIAAIAHLPGSSPRESAQLHSSSFPRERKPFSPSSPGLSRSQSYSSAHRSPSSSGNSRQSSPLSSRRNSYRAPGSSPSLSVSSRAGRMSPSEKGLASDGLDLGLTDKLPPVGAQLPSPPASLNGAITSPSSNRALSTIRSNEELNHTIYGHRPIASASARMFATDVSASTGRPRPDRPPRSEARSAPPTPTAPTTPDKRLSMSSSIPLIQTSSPSVAGTPSRSSDHSHEQRHRLERLNLIGPSSVRTDEPRRDSVDTASSIEPYLDALEASRSPSPSPLPSPNFPRSSDASAINTPQPTRQAVSIREVAIPELQTRTPKGRGTSLPFKNRSVLDDGLESGKVSSSKPWRSSERQMRNQRILDNINSSSPHSGHEAAEEHGRTAHVRSSYSIDGDQWELTRDRDGPPRRSSWVGSERTRAASVQGAHSREGSEATSPSAIASPVFHPRSEYSPSEAKNAHTVAGSVSNSTRRGIPQEFLQAEDGNHTLHDQLPANASSTSAFIGSSPHGAGRLFRSPSSQSDNCIPTKMSGRTHPGDGSGSHPRHDLRLEHGGDSEVEDGRGQPASADYNRASRRSGIDEEGALPLEERRRRLRNLEVGSTGWISEFQAIRALQATRTRAKTGSEDEPTRIGKQASLADLESQPVSHAHEDFSSTGLRGWLPATSLRKRDPRRSMSRLSLVTSSGDVGAGAAGSSTASRNLQAGRPVAVGDHHMLVHAAYDQLHQLLDGIGNAPNSPSDASDASDLLKRTAATVRVTVKLNDGLRDLVQATANLERRTDSEEQRRRSMDSMDDLAESSILATTARSLLRTSNDQIRCLTEEIIALTRFERERHSTSQDEGRSPRSLSRASGFRPSTSLGIMSPARSGDQFSLGALTNATPKLRNSASRNAFSPLSLHSPSPGSRDQYRSPLSISQDGRAHSRASLSISHPASAASQYDDTFPESSPTVGSQSRRRNLLSNTGATNVRPGTPSSMRRSLSRASILSVPVFDPTNASTFESPTSRMRLRRASEVSFPSDTSIEAQRESGGDQSSTRNSFESSGTYRGTPEFTSGWREGHVGGSRSASESPEEKRETRRQEVEAILRRAAANRG